MSLMERQGVLAHGFVWIRSITLFGVWVVEDFYMYLLACCRISSSLSRYAV